jgi:hypothetical protein
MQWPERPGFSFPLASLVLIVQPYVSFWLLVPEGDWSPSHVALLDTLFFPSRVFDFLVRAALHRSPVEAFGALAGDIVLPFVLNAVVWALIISSAWWALGWLSVSDASI